MTSDVLRGKVAFITGAGSGLGAAFARRLADDGAFVVVNDVDEGAAVAIATEVNGAPTVFDVTDSAAFDTAVDITVERRGGIDIMINNAGIVARPPLDAVDVAISNQMLRMEGRIDEMQPTDRIVRMTDADFDRMIRTHLYGVFYGIRAALRHMTPQRSGSIVNVSSIHGPQPASGPPDYAAAKAAIIALTKSAAAEVAHLGIRVNAICPGYIETPLLDVIDPLIKAAITARIRMGRMGSAQEIAELVRFVAGPESSYSTGDVFQASGGFE